MARTLVILAVAVFGVALLHSNVCGAGSGDPRPVPGASLLVGESAGPRGERNELDEIDKRIKEMIKELERLQKEAAQRFRKDVLPRLQKELDRLRDWLQELQLDKDGQPRTRET